MSVHRPVQWKLQLIIRLMSQLFVVIVMSQQLHMQCRPLGVASEAPPWDSCLRGPRTYGGKKWKRPIEKEYKPTYRHLV